MAIANIINGLTNNLPVTITLASLVNTTVATSSTIDNSVNKFMSANFEIVIRTGIGTSSDGSVCVMLLRSSDGGTTFDDADESNAMVLITFNANTNSTSYRVSADTSRNSSLLPEFFRIAILNETGATFDSTPGNFSVKFSGKRITTVP